VSSQKAKALYAVLIIVIIGIVASMAYGGWLLSRSINYKFGYESMVHDQIERETAPLKARIEALEKRSE
jgi:hypothetical protein